MFFNEYEQNCPQICLVELYLETRVIGSLQKDYTLDMLLPQWAQYASTDYLCAFRKNNFATGKLYLRPLDIMGMQHIIVF